MDGLKQRWPRVKRITLMTTPPRIEDAPHFSSLGQLPVRSVFDGELVAS
jgi:hypothetical protein